MFVVVVPSSETEQLSGRARVQGSKTLVKNVGVVLKNSAGLVSLVSHVP